MARRLNKVEPEEAPKPPPTYTEEQKAEALERLEEKHAALMAKQEIVKKANGSYRAELKECAKIMGIESRILVRALKAKDLEPADIEREEKQFHTVCIAMGLPLLDYAAALRPAPKKAKAGASEQDAVVDAHNDGLAAGKGGKNRTDNPHPPGSKLEDAWAKGWIVGQSANVPNGKAPAAKERRPRAKKNTAAAPGLPLADQPPAGAAD